MPKQAARRVVGMVRVSKVGARDEILSPMMQREAITAYAERTGMVVDRWVEALDESGSQRSSPWWRRLDEAVGWVEAGEVDGILVWRFSRAARHRRHWAVALDRVEVAGGVLESATEQLDTTTSTGRLARGMLAELAAWESEVKGEQWREVHRNRINRGLPASGQPRLGYLKDDAKRYTPDPRVAPVVRRLYERYVDGERMASLREHLRNEAGVTMSEHGIQAALDSGFAAGLLNLRASGEKAPGSHRAIIDEGLWARYQQARQLSRSRSSSYKRGAQILTGLIKCSACGSGMTAGPGGSGYRSYKCIRRKGYGAAGCPGAASVSERRVHEAIKEWLAPMASDIDARTEALMKAQERQQTARQQRDTNGRRLKRIDVALERLAQLYADGEVDIDHYRKNRERYKQDQREALTEQNALTGEINIGMPSGEQARTLLGSWDEWVEHDPKGLRDALACLIARVEVSRGVERLSTVTITPRWDAE